MDCVLISASCTTGWFDCIHGELWLCPGGLLRRSLGLGATVDHYVGPTVDRSNCPTRIFSAEEVEAILASDRRNRWIPWEAISSVTLKRGVLDSSLHLTLVDGRREKFLWLKIDGGYDVLQYALSRQLPGRFEALDKAFG